MTLYLLSLIPLVAAPALLRLFSAFPSAARALDSFILVSVSGLIVLHILPHSVEQGGPPAMLALFVGLLVPFAAERFLHAGQGSALSLPVALGLMALAVHGMLDGLALAGSSREVDSHGQLLAAAVLLHRLPAGLAVWWLVQPRFGRTAAWGVVGLLVAATTLGFGAPEVGLSGFLAAGSWYVVQALLAGSLIHVVLHQSMGPSSPKEHSRWQRSSLVGALLAVSALVAIEHLMPHGEEEGHSAMHEFAGLFLAVAPPVVAAYLLAAVAHVFRPRRLESWLSAGSAGGQVVRGSLSGLTLNVCSCGVADLYHGLVHRGASPVGAFTLLVAAPELAVGAVLVSLRLLGVEVGVVRIVLALVLGLVVGLVLGRMVQRHAPSAQPAPVAVLPIGQRLKAGLKYAFGELLDETMPWLLVGLLLAALVQLLLDPTLMGGVPGALHVPLMALIGAPIFVCATGSTPLVAVLMLKGLSPGAAIAFLLTGPATNAAVWDQLAHLHGRKVAAVYTLGILLLSIMLGWIADFLLPDIVQDWHAHAAGESSGWAGQVEMGAALVLAALVLLSVARQGMPRFLGRVLTLHGHHHGASTGACCEGP